MVTLPNSSHADVCRCSACRPKSADGVAEDTRFRLAAEQSERGVERRIAAAREQLLRDTLQECAEVLDDYVDVNDGEDGNPRPNRAMSIVQQIESVLKGRP